MNTPEKRRMERARRADEGIRGINDIVDFLLQRHTVDLAACRPLEIRSTGCLVETADDRSSWLSRDV